MLGEAPQRLLGYGAAQVFSGAGYVAKIGPPAVVAREARILGDDVALPLTVPRLVASGPGWLVMEEVPDEPRRWDEDQFAALLGDLARLHDAFEGSRALDGGWLRDPAGRDLAETIAEGGDRSGVELPGSLARVLDDPSQIASILLNSQPITLVHGDPTPNNVRRPPGHSERVWIDWEWASAAPAAIDLACWLAEGPWQFARPFDHERYLAVYFERRARPIDHPVFRRALDAALVLFLFSDNLPSLARSSGREALQLTIAERAEALKRLGL